MRVLTIAMMLVCGPAAAGEVDYGAMLFGPPDDADYQRTAQDLAKCSGFWRAYGEFVRQDKPEAAELLNGVRNGGVLSAAFLVNTINGDWQKSVGWAEGISAAEHLYWRAIFATQAVDFEEIKFRSEECSILAPMQEMILGELRNQAAGID